MQIKMQVAEAEIVNDRKRMELEHQIAQAEVDAKYNEMLNIGKDRRKLQLQERLERLRAGESLGDPGDLSQHSYFLKDQLIREENQLAQEQLNAQEQRARQYSELQAAFAPAGSDPNAARPAAQLAQQQRIPMGGGAAASPLQPDSSNGFARPSDPGNQRSL